MVDALRRNLLDAPRDSLRMRLGLLPTDMASVMALGGAVRVCGDGERSGNDRSCMVDRGGIGHGAENTCGENMLSGRESCEEEGFALMPGSWWVNELLRLEYRLEKDALTPVAGETVIAMLVCSARAGRTEAAGARGVDPAADAEGAVKASWSHVSEGRFMAVVDGVVEWRKVTQFDNA